MGLRSLPRPFSQNCWSSRAPDNTIFFKDNPAPDTKSVFSQSWGGPYITRIPNKRREAQATVLVYKMRKSFACYQSNCYKKKKKTKKQKTTTKNSDTLGKLVHFSPAVLRYNWHIELYRFKVCSIMIWLTCVVKWWSKQV